VVKDWRVMNWKEGDIDGVAITPLRLFTDDRGWLTETFRDDELPDGFKPAMSYMSATHPGVTRGPHEHREQTDLFAFSGPGTFMVRLWDNRKSSPTFGLTMSALAGEETPSTIMIPPGIVHAYKNVSDHDAYYVNYPDKLFAGEKKSEPIDEIRHEDADPQEFVF
jgi:dTDP-4-dehydrorhamnose 3,5-epimerase